MPVNWTETRLKRLKLLHKEGFSATIIAGKLGPAFTKSIVLRKVHQLEEERLARAKALAARKAATIGETRPMREFSADPAQHRRRAQSRKHQVRYDIEGHPSHSSNRQWLPAQL